MINDSQILFIVGCPRSGTTWLHRLVASHPLCITGMESNLIDHYIAPLIKTWKNEPLYFDDRGPNGLCCYLKKTEFLTKVKRFALSLFGELQVPEDGYFIEKTPSGVCFVKDIIEIFPNAKIVIIHRHPYQVIPSLLEASKTWAKSWAPTSLWGAIRMWQIYAKCTISAFEYKAHENVMIINFDRLRNDTRSALGEIYEFMNIKYTGNEIDTIIFANQPGNDEVLKIPLYGEYDGQYLEEPEGFYRKQDKDRFLNSFQKFLIALVLRNEIRNLGYDQ